VKQSRPLSRSEIDVLIAELVAFEAKAEAKRAELLRHWREGSRKDQTWTLRGHEWDVLLTRAAVVSILSQNLVDQLPRRLRQKFFFLIHAPFETTRELRRSSPAELPARVRKLLKLSRHWRIKPESRATAQKRNAA